MKAKPTAIPQVPRDDSPEIINPAQPADDDFTGGQFKDIATGELFALAIHPPDSYGRTHTLKNTAHFVQCKEAEFRARFEKP